jgi:hypothetical protein
MKKIVAKFLFTGFILILLTPYSAKAIFENEYRIGFLAGNLQPGGTQKTLGSSLGYGFNFGYMFSDEMLFNIDSISTAIGKEFKQSRNDVGVSYYFTHLNTTYFNMSGGMSLINNNLTVGSETTAASASGFYYGLGLDFDLGAHFVAGFDLRFNTISAVKRSTDSGIEVTVIDSFSSTLLKLAYVF